MRNQSAAVRKNTGITLEDEVIYFAVLNKAKAGKTVDVSVAVSGKGKAIAYLESFGKNRQRIASSTVPFEVSDEPLIKKFSLTVPEGWTAPVLLYLRSTKGSLVNYSLLSVKIRKSSPQDNVLPITLDNAKLWQKSLRSPGAAATAGNSKVTLKDDCIYMTRLPALPRGMRYHATVKVSGKGSAMAYMESFSADKRWISTSALQYAANGQQIDIIMDMPKEWSAPITLMLRTLKGNEVTFSDFKITAVPGISRDEKLNELSFVSGSWQKKTSGTAKIVNDKNAVTLSGEAVYSMQLPAIPGGSRITLSSSVSGKGKYMFYAESAKGNQIIHSSRKELQADQVTKKQSAVIRIPEIWQERITVVLRTFPGAEVKFSDFKIQGEKAASALHLSRLWRLSGGSRVAAFSNQEQKGTAIIVEPLDGQPSALLPGFSLIPGKRYEIEYLIQGVGSDTDSTGFHHYQPEIFTSDGKRKMTSGSWNDAQPGKPVKRKFTFRLPHSFSSNYALSFKVDDHSRIAVAVTGFKEIIPKPEEHFRFALNAPSMTGFIYSSFPINDISGKVIAPEAAACKITCGGKDFPCKRIADGFAFSIPMSELAGQEKFVLQAALSNADGKVMRTVTKDFRRLPPGKMEVVIDKDHFFRINGKRFMPIFSSRLAVEGRAVMHDLLPLLAAGGFNTVSLAAYHDESNNLKMLDIVHQYGMKAILRLPQPHSDDTWDKFTEVAKKTITPAVAAHPALFIWGYADEPAWTGCDQRLLCRGYEFFRTLDPYHPIWINAAPPSDTDTLRFFSQAADIYGVDVYPVPKAQTSVIKDPTLAIIGKQARYTYDAMDHAKPIFMYLQSFAWGDLNPAPGKPVVYPTYHQLRFMAFDAMLNDSKGIGWYTLGAAPSKSNEQYREFLFAIWKVNREIASLTDIFLAPGNKTDVLASGITVKKWTFAEGSIRMILNTLSKPQTFEDLTFAPFEVKIIKEGKVPPLRQLPPPSDKSGDNLFINLADSRGENYDGKSNWVWAKERYGKFFSTAVLAKELLFTSDIAKVELLCCADDMGSVWLNGKKINDFTGWSRLTSFDLTKSLNPGKNLLLLSVKDGTHPPHGAMAEIRITGKDGKISTIVTDSTWVGTAEADEKSVTFETIKKWQPPVLITPYGGGPWRKNVKMPLR